MAMNGSGQREQLELLYKNYRYLMRSVAFCVLRDDFLAEDAVHNAFVRVAKNIDRVPEAGSAAEKRYLVTVAKNAAIDIYRRRKRLFGREICVDELGEREAPLLYEDDGEAARVLDILRDLPVKYRDVFLLKYSCHRENREIAQMLGLSEGAVRQRLARGKAMIRERLDELERGDGI